MYTCPVREFLLLLIVFFDLGSGYSEKLDFNANEVYYVLAHIHRTNGKR